VFCEWPSGVAQRVAQVNAKDFLGQIAIGPLGPLKTHKGGGWVEIICSVVRAHF
jgi:hypothetical protein